MDLPGKKQVSKDDASVQVEPQKEVELAAQQQVEVKSIKPPVGRKLLSIIVSVLLFSLAFASAASIMIYSNFKRNLDSLPKVQPEAEIEIADEPINDNESEGVSTQVGCENSGGVWLEEQNECENITEEGCASLSGSYEDCASPCRHDPSAEVCIKSCVAVCSF